MKLTANEFLALPHKNITLLGMSGIGKTHLSRKMIASGSWFHYSGDYRIGTRYLEEPIIDNIKHKLMSIEYISNLLKSDSLYVSANTSIDNLETVTNFLGKVGNPEQGGLSLAELKKRHNLHHKAEINAMRDVPDFIYKAQEIYNYKNFLNDAGGSLCDLDSDSTFEILAKHSVIIYIHADEEHENTLKKRAYNTPKPLYYKDEYIDQFIADYLKEKNIEWVACIDPDEFTRWVFPRLLNLRIPKYIAIAEQYGYQISAKESAAVQNETDFINLIATAIDRKNTTK